MASIHREIEISRSPADVWDAIRDVGQIHKRLVRGFVTDCRLEDGGAARVVTFANGMTVREPIVSVDDDRCRHAWAAQSTMLTHYNASVQVFPAGEDEKKCRVVWIADLLPHDAAAPVAAMIEQGLAAMKQTLEARAAGG
jgi:hypothetical protein